MWRSLFLALGISAVILGVECLAIDKATLAKRDQPAPGQPPAVQKSRDIVPPDWAPWSLLSTGAVTMLYSFTLPKRGG
jgi:hypothetical protein